MSADLLSFSPAWRCTAQRLITTEIDVSSKESDYTAQEIDKNCKFVKGSNGDRRLVYMSGSPATAVVRSAELAITCSPKTHQLWHHTPHPLVLPSCTVSYAKG